MPSPSHASKAQTGYARDKEQVVFTCPGPAPLFAYLSSKAAWSCPSKLQIAASTCRNWHLTRCGAINYRLSAAISACCNSSCAACRTKTRSVSVFRDVATRGTWTSFRWSSENGLLPAPSRRACARLAKATAQRQAKPQAQGCRAARRTWGLGPQWRRYSASLLGPCQLPVRPGVASVASASSAPGASAVSRPPWPSGPSAAGQGSVGSVVAQEPAGTAAVLEPRQHMKLLEDSRLSGQRPGPRSVKVLSSRSSIILRRRYGCTGHLAKSKDQAVTQLQKRRP